MFICFAAKENRDMVYLVPLYMLGVLLLGIRAANWKKKFFGYLETHYPQIMSELESKGWSSIKWSRALYRRYDVPDPVLQNLKKKAKNAEDLFCVCFLVPVMLIVGLAVLALLFGR